MCMECLLLGMGVSLFLGKASGFVLEEPGAMSAARLGWRVILGNLSGIPRPLGSAGGPEFFWGNDWWQRTADGPLCTDTWGSKGTCSNSSSHSILSALKSLKHKTFNISGRFPPHNLLKAITVDGNINTQHPFFTWRSNTGFKWHVVGWLEMSTPWFYEMKRCRLHCALPDKELRVYW